LLENTKEGPPPKVIAKMAAPSQGNQYIATEEEGEFPTPWKKRFRIPFGGGEWRFAKRKNNCAGPRRKSKKTQAPNRQDDQEVIFGKRGGGETKREKKQKDWCFGTKKGELRQ